MAAADVAPNPDATIPGWSQPLVVCAEGPGARAALWHMLDEARRAQPLAALSVAVPSTYAGLSLRRATGRRPGGLANVRFGSLNRVAELLGAPFLAEPDRRPLTPALRAGAVRAVLAAEPGSFAPVANHPMTARSLAATFAELAALSDAALDRLAAAGGRAADTVTLWRRFRTLTAGFYDDEEQLHAAAEQVRAGSVELDDVGTVLLFAPRDLSPGAHALIGALAGAGRAGALVTLTGDRSVDAGRRALVARLETTLGPARVEPSPSVPPIADHAVSCADASEEARWVVRDVVRRVEAGAALHAIAVGYRLADPYARLLHHHFEVAGIPVYGPAPRRLTESVAGRTLAALLTIRADGYRRDALAALLAGAPVLETAGGGVVPGARWERLSCAANIVGGLEQWGARLGRHAEQRRARLADRAARAGELFADDGTDTVLGDCTRLAGFVAELADRLEPPEPTTWASLARWARGLLERYLGPPVPSWWPATEAAAYEEVLREVDALAGLGELDAPASPAAFTRTLADQLDRSLGHLGAVGDGVFVGPLGALAATAYDLVYLVGAAETTFPPPVRDDPVLPDLAREVAGGALPKRAERMVAERASYLAALAAAPERVLTFPRADVRAGRAVRPAAWLLESLSARRGQRVSAAELDVGDDSGRSMEHVSVVPSFEHTLREGAASASVQDFDVSWLLAWHDAGRPLARHPLCRAEPRLGAGYQCVAARGARRLGPWDGVVGPFESPAAGVDTGLGNLLSSTMLETWAHCPFRFLGQHVLGIRSVERPEERDRMDPRVRGIVIHDVLESFFSEHRGRPPDHRWTAEERARLRARAGALCDGLERDGLTGRALLWQVDRDRLLREIDRVLDTDEHVRAERGLVPEHCEATFGEADDPLGPLVLTVAETPVTFRGRIDRIDRGRDGHLEVFDYKTGAPGVTDAHLAEDPVRGGTHLQLALYALAARNLDPAVPVHASYWYTRAPGDEALAGFTLDDDTEARLLDVLDTVVGGITAGNFPAYPGAEGYFGPENCGYCDFDRLCPHDRVRHFERRRDDPAYEATLWLREEPDDDDDDEPDPGTGGETS